MLAKSTDNVLPIEGTARPAGMNQGRHIGAILMDEGKLTASDAEQVLKRQRELGWRFGEAAIELNLITDNDLRQALAKQYEFPYLVSGPEGVAKELIAAWDPFHPVVEELRSVRTQLLIRWYNPGAGRRTLAIASPWTMIGSDAYWLNGTGHPRTTGTYSRVLGRYVREKHALTLMDAVRKMTLMPAQRLESRVAAMKRKGRLAVGADADLTIFDPARVLDRSTYRQPSVPPAGIEFVVVNGVVVVSRGQAVDGVAPGVAIRAER